MAKRTNTKEGRVQVDKLETATVPVKRGESDILESEDYLETNQPKKKRRRKKEYDLVIGWGENVGGDPDLLQQVQLAGIPP